ncbi:PorV/PorQ family protein [Gemmatimonas aurantiaca]|nr:PorV/PorQ family protein [Gemmatimonas aurantiaca]
MIFSKRSQHLLATLTIALTFTAVTNSEVFAQAKVGSTGFQSLELEVSARGMAMGGAFTAVVDDISAVFYNPAGLPYLFYKEVMVTHIALPAGINMEFIAIGLPLESIGGVLGISGTFLSTGDIPYTTYQNYDGTDAFGNRQYFDAGERSLAISYGRYLTDRFSVGFTMKWLSSDLADVRATGWAADVGTLYNTGFRDFKVAMAITNFGPDMTHLQAPTPLPINFHFGASINAIESDDHLAIFSMEGSHPSDNLEKYNIGMEYWFLDKYALRGGVRLNNDLDAEFKIEDGAIGRKSGAGLTFGAGMRLPMGDERELRIDYAYQNYQILTEVHRFTFSLIL